MYQKLEEFFTQFTVDVIPTDRKRILEDVVETLKSEMKQNGEAALHFICTHNSRRSQLAQVLAQTLVTKYHQKISCYSGGTEVTAFHFSAVETLHELGYRVTIKGDQNPVYTISFDESNPSIRAFSKVYDDDTIPERFVAIMTCSDADENCPYIPHAIARIPVRYEDPKVSDGTSNARNHYMKTAIQIASEWNYIFSKL